MRLLIVEDDPLKAESLVECLQELTRSHNVVLSIRQSYRSGLDAIESGACDFVILDMTIPTFDPQPLGRQGRPRSLGGYELMRKLKRKGIAVPVFIVSQLEAFGEEGTAVTLTEMTAKCEVEFPSFFVGSTFFSRTDFLWRGELRAAVSKQLGGTRND